MAVTTRIEPGPLGLMVLCLDCGFRSHHRTRESARADRARHEVRHHGVAARRSAAAAAVRKANQRAREASLTAAS